MIPSYLSRFHGNLLNNTKSSLYFRFLKPFLILSSLPLYFISRLRSLLYRKQILNSYQVEKTAISIGNITLGGTGKTPFTLFLINKLKQRNLNPAIITRGYGNDETIIYQNTWPNVPLIINPNRVEGANDFCKNIKNRQDIDLFLLDDAFQHQKIKRDLDIVLINGNNPFGYGYHLPAGYLRESPKSLSRAQIIIITHSDNIDNNQLNSLETKVSQLTKAPIFRSSHEPDELIGPNQLKINNFINFKKENENKKIALFSGLGDPKSFFATIRKWGITNIEWNESFPDHHPYTEKDMENLKTNQLPADIWITSEKDYVKLNPEIITKYNIYCLKMKMKVDEAIIEEIFKHLKVEA